jgi:copper chaperone
METITLSVPEIHCGHCTSSIEGAVAPLPGVESASVDVDARTVRVTYGEPADLATIRAAIEDAGYEVP